MRAHLMYPDSDLDLDAPLPRQADALVQDLGLEVLIRAMAAEDAFVKDVVRRVLVSSTAGSPDVIRFRQAVLQDCLAHASAIRELYALACEAVGRKRRFLTFLSRLPWSVLRESIEAMEMLAGTLERLLAFSRRHAAGFRSEGFRAFFALVEREISQAYLAEIRDHLRVLRFQRGLLLGAVLGDGNGGTAYVVRRPHPDRRRWYQRLFSSGPPQFTYRLPERDEAGARALQEIRDRGIDPVANAVAQSNEHLLGFFQMVKTELAFYVGCLDLHERLPGVGVATSFPVPCPAGSGRLRFSGLRDVSLALAKGGTVVANTLDLECRGLVVITGPNQGGKSSFLRSVGLAQIMMQAGMFVPADAFEGEPCTGLFTHYKREEDASLESGKLDEELGRLSDLVDDLEPGAMVLLNESFAATNEREGSEIARQVVRAFEANGIRVVYVTHLFEFARTAFEAREPGTVFLRAERRQDGTRSFRVVPGEPLPTSHAADVFARVFAEKGNGRPGPPEEHRAGARLVEASEAAPALVHGDHGEGA